MGSKTLIARGFQRIHSAPLELTKRTQSTKAGVQGLELRPSLHKIERCEGFKNFEGFDWLK